MPRPELKAGVADPRSGPCILSFTCPGGSRYSALRTYFFISRWAGVGYLDLHAESCSPGRPPLAGSSQKYLSRPWATNTSPGMLGRDEEMKRKKAGATLSLVTKRALSRGSSSARCPARHCRSSTQYIHEPACELLAAATFVPKFVYCRMHADEREQVPFRIRSDSEAWRRPS